MDMLSVLKKDTIDCMYKVWGDLYANSGIKRCRRCILPVTTPYIHFDADGVCNFCGDYVKVSVKGEDELRRVVAPFRQSGRQYDCIVSLSGGRDSCFVLHYVKKVLKFNPLVYTYDWGMATDVALRNQERMCRAFGVERIVIKADYAKKRRNIRMNVEAWLKAPDLGLIPLLMAGDKESIYYGQQVKVRTKTSLMFHGLGNLFEDCLFKTGFSRVQLRSPMVFCHISTLSKIKLAVYYARSFLKNPAYINTSLVDTLAGYFSLFFIKPDGNDIFFYQFLKWDEASIMKTLFEEYGWERPTDTCLTWRIDDGTSAFYNYIYLTVAGFTENDTFRSCQIREGVMTREAASGIVERENKPRVETMEWYARTVGFDIDRAVRIINGMKRLYSL